MTLVFRSSDQRFGLALSQDQVTRLVELYSEEYPNETGGILIGHYNEQRDMALVTSIEPPTSDSKSGRTWFYRGFQGLARKLSGLWKQSADARQYYIGEWHSHPDSSVRPSQRDRAQMLALARTETLYCPEPILLIVGGNSKIGTYVFFRNGRFLELHQEFS